MVRDYFQDLKKQKKFIGRKEELFFIQNDFYSKNSYLNIITGRRGVGKTYFLNHFVENVVKKTPNVIIFNFNGSLNLSQKELAILFLENIFEVVNLDLNAKKNYFEKIKEKKYMWKFVFDIFKEVLFSLKNIDKISIIIDEFSWFCRKSKNNFAEEFGFFWLNIKTLLNIHCVVCGSSVGLMLDIFYKKSSGSLYHKADARIHLKPFTFIETLEFFKENHENNINKLFQLQYYLFTGGVVRYLDKIREERNLNENINLIFNEFINSTEKEFDFLFSSTFGIKQKNLHEKVILCFKKNNKLTFEELFKMLNKNQEETISKPTLYSTLKDLEEVDFIKKQINIKDKNESFYQICDLFCFYNLKFNDKKTGRFILENDDLLNKYNGYAFEIFAYKNISLIKEKTSRNGFKTEEYSFKNKNVQIDLIIDYGKNQYSIVECKHYNDFIKVDVGFQLNLKNKKEEFSNFLKKTRKNKHHIDIIVFSILGIENKHKANLNSNIIDINLKEELDLN